MRKMTFICKNDREGLIIAQQENDNVRTCIKVELRKERTSE